MLDTPRAQIELVAWVVTVTVLLAILRQYGKQVAEWIFMKLYEFFIQSNWDLADNG
jgi:hypothetical protein